MRSLPTIIIPDLDVFACVKSRRFTAYPAQTACCRRIYDESVLIGAIENGKETWPCCSQPIFRVDRDGRSFCNFYLVELTAPQRELFERLPNNLKISSSFFNFFTLARWRSLASLRRHMRPSKLPRPSNCAKFLQWCAYVCQSIVVIASIETPFLLASDTSGFYNHYYREGINSVLKDCQVPGNRVPSSHDIQPGPDFFWDSILFSTVALHIFVLRPLFLSNNGFQFSRRSPATQTHRYDIRFPKALFALVIAAMYWQLFRAISNHVFLLGKHAGTRLCGLHFFSQLLETHFSIIDSSPLAAALVLIGIQLLGVVVENTDPMTLYTKSVGLFSRCFRGNDPYAAAALVGELGDRDEEEKGEEDLNRFEEGEPNQREGAPQAN